MKGSPAVLPRVSQEWWIFEGEFAIFEPKHDSALNRREAKLTMRCALTTSLMALTLASSLMGEPAAPSLPFVGCISYGQADQVDAPTGARVRRTLSRYDMENLAYYKSAEIGLVAPKGWNCEGYSDSSGWGMFLSPEPIEGEPRWPNFHGPAMDLQHIRVCQ